MATIPNVYRERVIPQPSMDVAQHEAGITGRGLQQVGRAVAGIGAEVQEWAAKEQQRLEEAQADEAINKLRQKQIELTAGQPEPGKDNQGGYTLRRGADVVNPSPTGVSYLDHYVNRFGTERDAIGKPLTGRALEKYNSAAGRIGIDFQAGLFQHALRESDSYYKQTYDSTVKSEALSAGANWNNPVAVVEALRRVSEATEREADRQGLEDVDSLKQEALAGVHASVVESALRDGDAKFAEEYMREYKDGMPAHTALKLHDAVQSVRKQQIALEAADRVVRQITHRIMPSDADRIEALALARPPVADKKAIENPQKFFREALKQHGGDAEKALATYALGPKAVAEAEVQALKSEREHKKDPNVQVKRWLDFIPKETRASIEEDRKAYSVGAGVTEPTLLEVKNMVQRQVLADNPTATGDQIEAAQTKAEQWFNDMRATRTQMQENALLDVQQRVDAGKVQSVHDLTPQDLSLLGGRRTAARSYIEGAQGDQDKLAQASPAAREQFDRLMSSPDVLAGMDAATLMSLTPEFGKKWVDDLLRRKQDYLTNPEKFTAARVDADLFEATIAPFMRGVSRSDAALRKHQIRMAVEAEIAARRAAGESGLAIDKDKPNIIVKYAMKYPVEKPGYLFGTRVEQVPGTALPSVEQVPLAPEEVEKIRTRAAKLGLTNLTDSDILRVYRMTQAAKAAK